MATEMEVTPISDEEELEEGEIDSSDEEEEKKESESSDKLTEAAKDTPVANEGRKRHHSSTPSENSPKNDKVMVGGTWGVLNMLSYLFSITLHDKQDRQTDRQTYVIRTHTCTNTLYMQCIIIVARTL